jgi:hypothetical protein
MMKEAYAAVLDSTEIYSYQLFTSTNMCSINLLFALLEYILPVAVGSLPQIHSLLKLRHVHIYWSYMSSPYYCSCLPAIPEACSYILLLLPFIQFVNQNEGQKMIVTSCNTDLQQH